MDLRPENQEPPELYRRRLWGLSREQAERAARDGTGWIIGTVGGMIGVPAAIWSIAEYGPISGGLLSSVIAFVVVYLVFLVIRRLDAPKADLERRLAESDGKIVALESRIKALDTPLVFVKVEWGGIVPTVAERNEVHSLEIHRFDDETPMVFMTKTSGGSPNHRPGIRGSKQGEFFEVNVINQGTDVLTEITLDFLFYCQLERQHFRKPFQLEIDHLVPDPSNGFMFYIANHSDWMANMHVEPKATAKRHGESVEIRVEHSDLRRKVLSPLYQVNEEPQPKSRSAKESWIV